MVYPILFLQFCRSCIFKTLLTCTPGFQGPRNGRCRAVPASRRFWMSHRSEPLIGDPATPTVLMTSAVTHHLRVHCRRLLGKTFPARLQTSGDLRGGHVTLTLTLTSVDLVRSDLEVVVVTHLPLVERLHFVGIGVVLWLVRRSLALHIIIIIVCQVRRFRRSTRRERDVQVVVYACLAHL